MGFLDNVLTMSKITSLFPNVRILAWSKLKAFADDNVNVTQNLKFIFERVESFLGKGENAGYQHVSHFPKCFQKPHLSGSLKLDVCVAKG